MRTTFNPAQADLFGARDLHLCSSTPMAPGSEETSRLQKEVRDLRNEVRSLTEFLRMANDHLQEERRRVATLKSEVDALTQANRRLRQRQASASCVIPKATWRLLMQLVHPDKHDGSAASQAAAKWLNENKPE